MTRPHGCGALRRSHGFGLVALVACLALLTSCGEAREQPVQARVENGLALVDVRADAGGRLEPPCLGLSLLCDGSTLRASSAVDRKHTRFLTFERRGDKTMYGVYALWGGKNPIQVQLPFDETIPWPDRDHAQGLAYLLEMAGTPANDAKALVAKHAEAWFGEGLRAFVLVPLGASDKLPGAPPATAARHALILVELPRVPSTD
ncbi:MAG: hypothetical protein H6806_03255 [Planctomycetes bacterium]|nr:hypothetical protein [Planctomycetota bacterium]MCB9825291.1 hypothetical protein [Planctomycetota bacterium]MCB9828772.1 hypothetical protein [Planctomycetota bacterium]MCB9900777.1 hypothetical protein [Planctomycetota bacterium]